MNDFRGQNLAIGDEVVFVNSRGTSVAEFVEARITGFAPRRAAPIPTRGAAIDFVLMRDAHGFPHKRANYKVLKVHKAT